jgi:hypothetical protein
MVPYTCWDESNHRNIVLKDVALEIVPLITVKLCNSRGSPNPLQVWLKAVECGIPKASLPRYNG